MQPHPIRCLFLACSGVRVKNEELRSLGVTLPGFIERGNVIASLPSLGLLTLAAHTPSTWEIEYRETGDFNVFDFNEYNFDLVAISSLSAQIDLAYQISDFLRSNGIDVIIGGLHVSALPEEAILHATSIVIGEGEYAWQKVCADFENKKLQLVYEAKNFGPFNFSNARIPRYDLLKMDRYNRITVQSQRGCPRKCNFCASSITISNYKCKPIKQVVSEIKEISKLWPHPFIEFADDNTFLNKKWAKELLREIEKLKIRWFTETDISVSEDDELLALISRAGCYQILIGLESSLSRPLLNVDPAGWKYSQFSKYKTAIDKIQSYGISVNGCFVLGWDHDSVDSFRRTRDFIFELNLSEAQITILTPFPNTPLYEQLRLEGRLLKDKFWDSCTLFDLNFIPKQMTAGQLEEGIYWLFKEVYNTQATVHRKTIFKKCVRSKRNFDKKSANY